MRWRNWRWWLGEQLAYRVYHDGLTGLPNRALFIDRLEQAIARSRRSGKRTAVCLLDLDRFKSINDTLGHHAGDELLQQVALRVSQSLRGGDTLARTGGDEFVAVIPDLADTSAAAVVAAKIIGAFAAPFQIGGAPVSVTCSVGVSLFPEDGASVELLQRAADAAMYAAKGAGRNRYAISRQ